MALSYSALYTIPYYDVDVTRKMTLKALIRVAIQFSEDQCRLLGQTEDYIKSLGVSWVIMQYEIKVARLPVINEEVKITTKASSYNKYFCYRNFWYHDKNGNELIHIHTTFALMDIIKRKLHPILEEIIEPFKVDKVKRFYRAPAIQRPDEKSLQKKQYYVRYTDIDGNGHVNNACFLDWLLDPLGLSFLTQHSVQFLNLRYLKEVEYDSLVESAYSLKTDDGNSKLVTHHLICADGNVHADAEVIWR